MEGSCPASSASCSGFSGSSTIFFTSLISVLLQSERELGSSIQYPPDASQYLFDEYDFVVVGGGTAGSAVAARLSEVSKWNVLLIEAGGDPPFISNIPATFFGLQQTEHDWSFRTEPQEHSYRSFKGKQAILARGKVLGGSSVLNGMLYFRGFEGDFDSWAEMGNEGWSAKEILPFLKKLENFHTDDIESEESLHLHGTGGPMHVQRFQNMDLALALMDAVNEKGYTQLDDINGPNQIGFAYLHGTIFNGTRWSTAKGYLGQAKDRKNLHVAKYSHVSKIIVNPETKEAEAVEFISKDGRTHQVKIRKEVILSAGTINSAQILMLSGIGPEEHLKTIGITPIHNLNVGDNLQEHMMYVGSIYTTKKSNQVVTDESSLLDASYEYLRHRTGYFSTHYGITFSGFMKTNLDTEDDRPDIQIFTFVIPANSTEGADGIGSGLGLDDSIIASLKEMSKEGNVVFFTPTLSRPRSRGKILLKSTNPLDHPEINPNFLSDFSDVKTLVEGIRLSDDLMNSKAMKNLDVKRKILHISECEAFNFDTDEFWECMVRHVTSCAFHAVGTCKMGPSSDPSAVVDPQLRVHGVKGIRVADLSVLPTITTGPTAATAMMIGEKASDLIKREWL
ncbi:Glucose dehydrogenase [FAD, quinone] [Blattella germanica]|nr:Glucose dehydrogenase [FAD, quinone] [Blattella germanica]